MERDGRKTTNSPYCDREQEKPLRFRRRQPDLGSQEVKAPKATESPHAGTQAPTRASLAQVPTTDRQLHELRARATTARPVTACRMRGTGRSSLCTASTFIVLVGDTTR